MGHVRFGTISGFRHPLAVWNVSPMEKGGITLLSTRCFTVDVKFHSPGSGTVCQNSSQYSVTSSPFFYTVIFGRKSLYSSHLWTRSYTPGP